MLKVKIKTPERRQSLTYVTSSVILFSSISIGDFEQVNVSWETRIFLNAGFTMEDQECQEIYLELHNDQFFQKT